MCPQDTDTPTFPPLSLPHIHSVLSKLCDKQNSQTDRWNGLTDKQL